VGNSSPNLGDAFMNHDGGGRGLIVVILSIVLGIIIRFFASSNTRLYIVSVFRNIVIWLLVAIAISFVVAGFTGWVKPMARIAVWLTIATIALGLVALTLWL
jgi:small-conductance mechanosensitive channel